MSTDEGGEAPCRAHLIDDRTSHHATGQTAPAAVGSPVVADIGAVDTRGRSGAVWSLPHGGDLDANLVHLDRGDRIDAHVNNEVDVLVSVISGRGTMIVDAQRIELRDDVVVVVAKGSRREVEAGADGITYLSIHRRRAPLGIGTAPADDGGSLTGVSQPSSP